MLWFLNHLLECLFSKFLCEFLNYRSKNLREILDLMWRGDSSQASISCPVCLSLQTDQIDLSLPSGVWREVHWRDGDLSVRGRSLPLWLLQVSHPGEKFSLGEMSSLGNVLFFRSVPTAKRASSGGLSGSKKLLRTILFKLWASQSMFVSAVNK